MSVEFSPDKMPEKLQKRLKKVTVRDSRIFGSKLQIDFYPEVNQEAKE